MNDIKGKVLITGTSHGIGKAVAQKFLYEEYEVYGVDVENIPSSLNEYRILGRYHHIIENVKTFSISTASYSFLKDIDILINNAGSQENNVDDIDTNLISPIRITEAVIKFKHVSSILNVASISAHTGEEYPWYTASKGGLLPYTKNVAQRVAEWGCTCNSISPGGVITSMNRSQIENEDSWNKIMSVTPLKKWATTSEIADWIYFITACQTSMTGQDVIVDNGENIYPKFVE